MTDTLTDISEIGVPKAEGESWAEAAERLRASDYTVEELGGGR